MGIKAPHLSGPDDLARMLDSFPGGKAAAARALGVQERQIRRWLAGSSPTPKMALLALFWISPLGQSWIDCEVQAWRLWKPTAPVLPPYTPPPH
jgi:hypothetical protein